MRENLAYPVAPFFEVLLRYCSNVFKANIKLQNQMYVTRWITNMYKTTHFCIEVNNQVVNLQCVNFQLLQMWTKFQFQFLQQWIKLSNLNKLITILALGNLRCKISLFPNAVFQNCPWHIYSSSISSKKNQKKHTHTHTQKRWPHLQQIQNNFVPKLLNRYNVEPNLISEICFSFPFFFSMIKPNNEKVKINKITGLVSINLVSIITMINLL